MKIGSQVRFVVKGQTVQGRIVKARLQGEYLWTAGIPCAQAEQLGLTTSVRTSDGQVFVGPLFYRSPAEVTEVT